MKPTREHITGLLLAGGRGMRMGGADKGLQMLGLSAFMVLAAKGGVILLAALFDGLRLRTDCCQPATDQRINDASSHSSPSSSVGGAAESAQSGQSVAWIARGCTALVHSSGSESETD